MKVVLTADRALMSDYNGTSYMGFVSALPSNLIEKYAEWIFFPTHSDEGGRALMANYSIAKIEAVLLKAGFSRDEVVLADPTKLDRVVDEDTRVLGVTCMDPLSLGYGSGIVNMAMMLFGFNPQGISYMSKKFLDVINHPSVKKHRPKIIVGGQASWQILDANMQEQLGIDTVVLGEGEKVTPELFRMAVEGKELPRVVNGPPVDASEIPPIVTPSIGGTVEITRGCGRGCRYCSLALLKSRSMPIETILAEAELNLSHGANGIGLHSEDFLMYGSKNFLPEEDKVLWLFENVEKVTKKYGATMGTDFVTAANTMVVPKVVERVGRDYVNVGGSRSFIEMGIETGSPRLMKIVMPGKALPFKVEEYPEIVRQAIGVLNDAGWTVVGTLITRLPGETEDDVIKTIELLDKIKDLNVVTFVLPFIPIGQLRGSGFVVLKEVLEDDLRRELFLTGLTKAIRQINRDLKIVSKGITGSAFAKIALSFAAWYMMRKSRKFEGLDHRELLQHMPEVQGNVLQ